MFVGIVTQLVAQPSGLGTRFSRTLTLTVTGVGVYGNSDYSGYGSDYARFWSFVIAASISSSHGFFGS